MSDEAATRETKAVVPERVELINEQIDRLDHAISNLKSKVAPVSCSNPPMPEKVEVEPKTQQRSSHASALDSICVRLFALTAQVQTIHSEIEL